MTDEQRPAERTEVATFATVRVEGAEHICETGDLSVTGILLTGADDLGLAVGDAIEIEFELPESHRTIELDAEVARIDGGEVGLHFSKVPKKIIKAIARFVDESY